MPKSQLFSLVALLGALAAPAHAQTLWPRSDAEELLATIEGIGAEGLDPADYEASALRRELTLGNAVGWSGRATTAFNHLATDLSIGHLRDRRSVAWRINSPARPNIAFRYREKGMPEKLWAGRSDRCSQPALRTSRTRSFMAASFQQCRRTRSLPKAT
jgi:hypothetical protein